MENIHIKKNADIKYTTRMKKANIRNTHFKISKVVY